MHFSVFHSSSIRSVLTFTDPSEADLGLYTVEMRDDPNQSSSYDFTAEGKLRHFTNCLVHSTASPQEQPQENNSSRLTEAGLAGLLI